MLYKIFFLVRVIQKLCIFINKSIDLWNNGLFSQVKSLTLKRYIFNMLYVS